MRAPSVLLFPCVMGMFWAPFSVSAQQGAVVTVWAETQDGQPVATASVELIELDSKRSQQVSRLIAKNVPYGDYSLRVSAPGYRTVVRSLHIDQERIDVRAVLLVSQEITGRMRLEGVVHEQRRGDGTGWVCLFPLAGSPSATIEGRLDESGRFSVSTNAGGPYLLTVLRGSHLLYQQVIYFGYDLPPLEIRLR